MIRRWLLRTVWPLMHVAAVELGGWASVAASWRRGPRQMVRMWPDGEVALGPRVALFVHFDRGGTVRPPVFAYLRALGEAGLEVAFVSNAGHLDDDSMAQLRPLCRAVLVRRNIGHDFGAIREALERLGLPRPETELLVIANDSVYGPLWPLHELLARADLAAADLWGATESWQRRYHLQSYFLVAGRAVLTSPAWRDFWQGVRPVRSKYWVVSRYEIGLTQALLGAGLRCAALWPYRALAQRVDTSELTIDDEPSRDPFVNARRIHTGRVSHAIAAREPLNPTAELWRQLLEAGFPFIKRELLQRNPARIIDIADWQHVATRQGGQHIAMIEHDLQRVMRNRAP